MSRKLEAPGSQSGTCLCRDFWEIRGKNNKDLPSKAAPYPMRTFYPRRRKNLCNPKEFVSKNWAENSCKISKIPSLASHGTHKGLKKETHTRQFCHKLEQKRGRIHQGATPKVCELEHQLWTWLRFLHFSGLKPVSFTLFSYELIVIVHQLIKTLDLTRINGCFR